MDYTWMNETPVGRLLLAGDAAGLKYVVFDDGSSRKRRELPLDSWTERPAAFRDAVKQLQAYFSGRQQQFNLPLAAEGTEFQKRVWRALCDIPYGETVSYGEIACSIGRPTASRAVGLANGRNPLSIVVPCHRVIGSSGKLVGYGGGLSRKTCLLRLEGVNV